MTIDTGVTGTLVPEDELRKARGLAPSMPLDEMQRRVARCQALIDEHGLDAILLWSGGAWKAYYVRYLANLVNPFPIAESMLMVPVHGSPTVMIDREWFASEVREMTEIDDVVAFPFIEFDWQLPELVKFFAKHLGPVARNRKRIGIAMRDLPATYYAALSEALPEVEFVDITPLLNQLVEVKTEFDKARLGEAAQVATAAMSAAIEACREGTPDYEVGLAALRATVANGGEIPNPDQHFYLGAGNNMMSNVRSYWHTGRPLQQGDMFWIDLGVCYKGYYMDFCRTVCIGEPSAEQRALFNVVKDTYDQMWERLRPGVTGSEMWEAGFEPLDAQGYGDHINHVWVGHGTGIKTSEPPFFIKGEPREVKAGSFATIEPGVLVPEVGMVTIEDVVYVGEDENQLITTHPNDLHVR